MTTKIIPVPPPGSKLTVIEQAPTHITPNGTRITMWKCRCECGNFTIVVSQKIRSGHTKSCGCDKSRLCADANVTHGNARIGKRTRTYRIWTAMWTRCTNPKQKHWQDYGGRGITVAERWKSFENFMHDLGECPDGLTIERKDTNGPYEPGNCVWASYTTQARNKRNNVRFKIHGFTGCITELSERYGIDRTLVDYRLRRGWSPEKAFTYPVKRLPPRAVKPPVNT